MRKYSILIAIIGVFLAVGVTLACYQPPVECEYDCASPTPSVSPEPSVTPEPETVVETHDQPSGGSYSPPACNGVPAEPFKLWGFKTESPTSVTFTWENKGSVDYYAINYGYTENGLVYGVPNITGSATSITLNGLQPGVQRWAQVTAFRNNCSTVSNKLDP